MEFDMLAEELEALGLKDEQAKVYLRLLQAGPAKVANLTQFFDRSRSTLYRILDELTDKGVVTKSLTQPTVYEAVDPGELFELGEAELRRAQERLDRVKERCEDKLRALTRASAEGPREHRWRKMEGTTKIYQTLHEMTETADDSLWAASNHEVTFAGYLPYVEEAWRLAYRRADEDEIDVRLLFDLGEEPYRHVPEWIGEADTFRLRNLEADGTIHFILADGEDLLMWVRPAPLGSLGKRDDIAVRTDAPGSVFAHCMLFECMWSDAPDATVEPAQD